VRYSVRLELFGLFQIESIRIVTEYRYKFMAKVSGLSAVESLTSCRSTALSMSEFLIKIFLQGQNLVSTVKENGK